MPMAGAPVPSNLQSRAAVRTSRAEAGCALAVIIAILASGCSTASRQGRSEDSRSIALVEVENRTSYVWKLTFRRDGQRGRVIAVPAGGTVSIEVAPGTYAIGQEAVGFSGNRDLSRSIEEKFEAGRHYRWPLLTLLSESAPPRGLP